MQNKLLEQTTHSYFPVSSTLYGTNYDVKAHVWQLEQDARHCMAVYIVTWFMLA